MNKQITAMLVIVGVAAGGCVSSQPVPIADGLSAPLTLFRPICERLYYPSNVPSGGAHWDGHATVIWESAHTDIIIGVECGLTRLGAGIETLETRIDIRDPTARDLRAFLAAHGAATATPFPITSR